MEKSQVHVFLGKMTTSTLRIGAFISILVGLGLLFITMVGWVLPPRGREVGDGIGGYHFRTRSIADAKHEAFQLRTSNLSDDEKTKILFEAIRDSFVHGENLIIGPLENWFLWARGFVHPSHRVPQDIDLLWERGQGMCRQSSMIFVGKALELGLQARLWLLTGHVVAEVYSPELSSWRVVDTDLGILWDYPLEQFGRSLSLSFVERTIRERGFPELEIQKLSDAYVTHSDNILASYPLSKERAEYETTAKKIKWGFPLLLVLVGSSILYGLRAARV